MFGTILLALSAVTLVSAQIPSLGFCPEYVPMANFNMEKFLGVWYEAERYFQLTEVVSRCVMANYTRTPDGKLRVSNEVTNRFTGIKRVLEGEIKKAASKAEEGKLHVKYTIPLTPETKYSVLETDYDTYAVLWSCSGIGPFHTQNAWIMTRERLAPGSILQKAYGVLDKYKISKTFFVKTDQDDCAYLDGNPVKPNTPEQAEEQSPAVEESQEVRNQNNGNYRSAVTPDAPEIIIDTKKSEKLKSKPLIEEAPTVVSVQEKEVVQPAQKIPERILKAAETSSKTVKEKLSDEEIIEVKEKLEESSKEAEKTA